MIHLFGYHCGGIKEVLVSLLLAVCAAQGVPDASGAVQAGVGGARDQAWKKERDNNIKHPTFNDFSSYVCTILLCAKGNVVLYPQTIV